MLTRIQRLSPPFHQGLAGRAWEQTRQYYISGPRGFSDGQAQKCPAGGGGRKSLGRIELLCFLFVLLDTLQQLPG